MFRPWHIPVLAVRPWRLVPELDRFEDTECAAVLSDLRTPRTAGLAVAFPIALVFGLALAVAFDAVLEWAFGPGHPVMDRGTIVGRVAGIVMGAAMVVLPATAAFVPYAAIMRAAIRRRLRRVSCYQCDYALIGLPVSEGAVVCPECGMRIVLEEHGLRPSDLETGIWTRAGTRAAASPPIVGRRVAVAAVLLVGAWVVTGAGLLLLASIMVLLMSVSASAQAAATMRR